MSGEAHHASAAGSSRLTRVATLVTLAALFACSNDRRQPAMDSGLSRDLQLASQVGIQPTFNDTALSSVARAPAAAPRRPTPRPARPDRPAVQTRTPVVANQPRTIEAPAAAPEVAPASAAAAARTIGAGVGMSMTSGGRVCSSTNRPGDKIVATIDAPVTGSNGAFIPAGSKAVLELVSASPGATPEQSRIVFRVRVLYVGDIAYQVTGNVTPVSDLERAKVAGNSGSDKKKVIGGAIAGAIIGQVLGHDTRSTVIGAATGAAAGTAVAKAGESYEGCLKEGAALRLTLAEPIVM